MTLSPARFISALGLSVSLAAPLAAQPVPPAGVPQAVPAPMALSALIAGWEEKGYRIKEVDVGRSFVEVEAIAPDGREVDLEINPVDGTIVNEHHDI